VWRAGANENTLITFSEPVKVNGRAVPAGQYSFYVLPQDNQDWLLIFNRVTTHWGSEGYDERDDLMRVAASSEAAPFHENLLYWFSEIKPTTARLNLTWEKRTVSMTIETEVHEQALRGIQKTLAANPGNWQLLAQAADYMIINNLQGELALRYINESIRLKDVYTNNWIKARLLASKQDYGTAIVYARKAIKMGDKNDDTFKAQLPSMRVALTDWQAKAY
jgi:tetratricopeptide (TPR) repeat protein